MKSFIFIFLFSFSSSFLIAGEDIEIKADATFKKYDSDIDIPDYKITKKEEGDIKSLISSSVLGDYSIKSLESIGVTVNSDEWKNKVSRYRKKITSNIGIDATKENLEFNNKDRVLIFISESVPIKTLRSYARDLEKVGGVFVMRGMIGGLKYIKPQAMFAAEVLRVDQSCRTNCRFRGTEILVDPIMFRKYGIEKVPAIVVQSGLNVFDYCHTTAKFNIEKNIIYGDSSLKFALKSLIEFDKRESVKSFESML